MQISIKVLFIEIITRNAVE